MESVQNECKDKLMEIAEKIVERAPYAVRLTPMGEILVYKKGDQTSEEPLSLIPCDRENALSVAQHDLMCTLYTAAQYIVETGRSVPITRDELIKPRKEGGCTEFGYTKGELQKLEKMELIKIGYAYLSKKSTGSRKRPVGARVVVYPTALGRGYIQKFIDKEFMRE